MKARVKCWKNKPVEVTKIGEVWIDSMNNEYSEKELDFLHLKR